ncbi:MAG: biosynthetic arginine decarboxylase [Acidobacteriota bacterium]
MARPDPFTIDDAVDLYGLKRWGSDYFHIGTNGHLQVVPGGERSRCIDVPDVVEELSRRGMGTPVLLRFPQLLGAQIARLSAAFTRAREEFGYPSTYHPVFPVKVNQKRQVVETLLQAGWEHGLGLEAGSLPELLAAMALSTPPGALTICNGFKDPNYLAATALAARLGKKVIVVIERPFEVGPLVKLMQREECRPLLGIRIRLRSRGSGLWEKSGGAASKFGLSTAELLATVRQLQEAGLEKQLVLLHFHIGSQLTEIRRVKAAVREGAHIYAKTVKWGVHLDYLDVGGGLGVDYDGSRTSSDVSMNYSLQEYANDVIYTIAEVCKQEKVAPPRVVSESGRMLTAYHAMLVTDVRGAIPGFGGHSVRCDGSEPSIVRELAEVAEGITVKNYREYYHDALEYREQLYNLFDLGLASLEDRAKGEELFWEIARRSVRHSRSAKFMAEEFMELEERLHQKLICNFSVFQSIPDHWALDHLFPVLPIHRLHEPPARRASLVDITCDSDGDVVKFIDPRDAKGVLEVHDLRPGEPYWVGVFLIGAYQDTMGDMHNLFGQANEADVTVSAGGQSVIRAVRPGQAAKDVLASFGYPLAFLQERLDSVLRERVAGGSLGHAEAEQLQADYRAYLGTYTYLS